MKGRRGDIIRTALGGGPVARQVVSDVVRRRGTEELEAVAACTIIAIEL